MAEQCRIICDAIERLNREKGTYEEVVRAVKEVGDVGHCHLEDGGRTTPLHFAAMLYQPKVAHLLVERGADINARDSDGNTPLAVACELERWALAGFLLDRGADPRIRNNQGERPSLPAVLTLWERDGAKTGGHTRRERGDRGRT